MLQAACIQPSMSRHGNALDNAPMESFFHTLKTELVHRRTYATHDEARRDLFAYVESWYNRQRLHSGLGYRTPAEAEQKSTKHSVNTPWKPSRINDASVSALRSGSRSTTRRRPRPQLIVP